MEQAGGEAGSADARRCPQTLREGRAGNTQCPPAPHPAQPQAAPHAPGAAPSPAAGTERQEPLPPCGGARADGVTARPRLLVRSHPVGEVRAGAAILGGGAGRGAGCCGRRRRPAVGGSECGLRAGGPHGRAVRLRGSGELVLGAAESDRSGVDAAGAAPRDLPGARLEHHPRRLRALGVRELPRLTLHRQQPGAGGRPAVRRRGPWGPGWVTPRAGASPQPLPPRGGQPNPSVSFPAGGFTLLPGDVSSHEAL